MVCCNEVEEPSKYRNWGISIDTEAFSGCQQIQRIKYCESARIIITKNTISVVLVLKISLYFVPCVETAFTSDVQRV